MPERWLSVKEIAEHLGNVRIESIYRWLKKGMPGHRVGRHWRFQRSEVDKWIKSGGANEKQ
jgi:excisionase family DNA binding protein